MRVAVVGAGLTGLFSAIALARRGHQVTLVDRDGGPHGDTRWERTGVMQFHQPHVFRAQVYDALLAETPGALAGAREAGVELITAPQPGVVLGLRTRRQVLEAALRAAADSEPGIRFLLGHADAVSSRSGRACGVVVDGGRVEADLVIDAGGRAGRLADRLRPQAESSDSGLAYVSRRYRLRPGSEPGPTNMPFGHVVERRGYESLVFPEDNGYFTTLVLRGVDDRELADLRRLEAFETVMTLLPGSREWTEPERASAAGPVRPGAGLFNSFRGQGSESGRPALPGLVSLGDTVCTTNPAAARGVSTSLLQVRRFLELLEEHPRDLDTCVATFDAWCGERIRPWFLDQVCIDAERRRMWAGEDIEPWRPLSSAMICAAAEQAPGIEPVARAYMQMAVLPAALLAVEPLAREIYASGWRPAESEGPSREDLVLAVAQAVSGAVTG